MTFQMTGSEWDSRCTIERIVDALVALMKNPYGEVKSQFSTDPTTAGDHIKNGLACMMLKSNKLEFEKAAKDWTKRYGRRVHSNCNLYRPYIIFFKRYSARRWTGGGTDTKPEGGLNSISIGANRPSPAGGGYNSAMAQSRMSYMQSYGIGGYYEGESQLLMSCLMVVSEHLLNIDHLTAPHNPSAVTHLTIFEMRQMQAVTMCLQVIILSRLHRF